MLDLSGEMGVSFYWRPRSTKQAVEWFVKHGASML